MYDLAAQHVGSVEFLYVVVEDSPDRWRRQARGSSAPGRHVVAEGQFGDPQLEGWGLAELPVYVVVGPEGAVRGMYGSVDELQGTIQHVVDEVQ